MVNISSEIYNRLHAAFKPETLEIIDDSHHHAGHAGARPEGQTHFTVKISRSAFDGKSRIEANRALMKELDDLWNNPLHALSIKFI